MSLIPMGFFVLAIILSYLLPQVDRMIDAEPCFIYSTSSAQATLSAIAAGMITFTGFVFSILTFAMQFGSSTFTLRLLQTIATNTTIKVALGVFVATFTYALLLLAEIDPGGTQYVPQYSVIFSVVLLGVSVLFFLRLMVIMTMSLRSGDVMAFVGREGRQVIEAAYPKPALEEEQTGTIYRPEGEPVHIFRKTSQGEVLQAYDPEGIAATAKNTGTVIELVPTVGDFVPSGAPVFQVYRETGPLNERSLLDSVAFGDGRTSRQDTSYSIRILVDIALKALSPAINDPTTAVQALDHIEDLLLLLGYRQLPDIVHRDEAGEVRLFNRTPGWDDYVSLALTEIRTFGADSPQVVERLRILLHRLHSNVPSWRTESIEEQSRLLDYAVAKAVG